MYKVIGINKKDHSEHPSALIATDQGNKLKFLHDVPQSRPSKGCAKRKILLSIGAQNGQLVS
jgi:hypothetical protein